MLAVITGTIRPDARVGGLVLRDEQERLKQYESSIRAAIGSGAFHKIIFCENSGFGTDRMEALTGEAESAGIQLELLSFHGNVEQVSVHGKGYGEGEIMAYVFSHSRIAGTETYFVKLTGRLVVDNMKKIVSRMVLRNTYFNIPNRTIRDIYDTRLYAMPVRQFQEFFMNCYDRVMDAEGIYLETVYTQILKEHAIDVHNFPRYPRITGVSGSGGLTYSYTEWKCRIKDVLSCLNYYKVK